jgi:site-specific recombinase XerD
VYHHFIHKVFIPFLRRSGIEKVTDITATVLFRFQDYLLAKGNKPQTVNSALSCIRVIFDRFVLDGVVTENVVSALPQVKIRTGDHYVRGCYDLADLKGVFNKPWGDPASFLLCLLIYTTGMRNSEIEKLQLQHIIELDGIRLIRIPESKTDNGVRVVPLHPFTWRALRSWAKQTGKTEGDYLFSLHGGPNQSTLYRKANQDMGLVLRLSESDLAERHITFYSGRHFYKTLLDAEGLGDIEEYFMGHKVSKDVAKRYNHRDKQGMDKIVKKAGEVFRALDRRLFRQKP